MFPDIGLHADAIKRMLPQEGQPSLYHIRMAILDLDESTKRYALKVLLALLVHEVASRERPPFNNARERDRPRDGKFQVIRSANGKVGEELHVSHTVRSQLQIAHGQTIFGLPPQGAHVYCLDAPG